MRRVETRWMMEVEPGVRTLLPVVLLPPSRQGEQRNAYPPRLLANSARHFVAAYLRQADVE